MNDRRRGQASIERLQTMEKSSHLRKDINDLRYKRQQMITDVKAKRQQANDLKEKRDSLNEEVKKLGVEAREHLKKRDEFQAQVKQLKEKRSGITQDIKPKVQQIRDEKEIRRQLNRTAHATLEELSNELEASLKTLFLMDLSLKEEVIMVDMVMNIQQRYTARKNANDVSSDIHKTWKDIKGIEEQASQVSFQIMSLAAESEKEHQAAMELFDKRDEASSQSQEYHENFINLMKDVRSISKEIDRLSREIDSHFKELKPLEKRLDGIRMTRREEQKLDKLRTAKHKMETTGKIGLEDLRILLETRSIDLKSDATVDQGENKADNEKGAGNRKQRKR